MLLNSFRRATRRFIELYFYPGTAWEALRGRRYRNRRSRGAATMTTVAGGKAVAGLAANVSKNTHAGFFYGTLMVPQIFYSVCYNTIEPPKHIQDRHTFHPAILHGHCRKRIYGVDYPGMIVDPQKSVRGTVVTGLSEANIQSLDFFEGSEYERRQVKPNILTKVGNAQGEGNEEGEEIIADTYIFMNHADLSVEGGEWDFEEFCRDKMQKWTRAGYVFEDCDPNQPATVAAAT